MSLLSKIFKKDSDEDIKCNPYYRKIPVMNYITLFTDEEIDFRKNYMLLKIERNKLKRQEADG